MSPDSPYLSHLALDLVDAMRGLRALVLSSAQAHGLSMNPWLALGLVSRQGPVTMGQLCEYLDLSHGAGTALVDKLAGAKWVVRSNAREDRRQVVVALTEDGRALVDAVRTRIRQQLGEALVADGAPEPDALAEAVGIVAGFLRNIPAVQQGGASCRRS